MGLVFAKNKLPNSCASSCEIFAEFTPFCKQSNALDPYFTSHLGKIVSEWALFIMCHFISEDFSSIFVCS